MIKIAIFGLAFIFLATILGSFLIFCFGNINKKIVNIFNGLSAGIMLSASIWSLLVPAISYAKNYPYIPLSIGLFLGSIFIYILGKYLSYNKCNKRIDRFFLAVTLHNIPEGLAVGLAFGLAYISNNNSLLATALAFSIGIGIQNIPEGFATTIPIYIKSNNKKKAFLLGMISGIVEPIFGIIGILLANYLFSLMPYLLAFSAGSMIFVIIKDLIPSFDSNNDYGTMSFIIGFIIMMVLDLLFG